MNDESTKVLNIWSSVIDTLDFKKKLYVRDIEIYEKKKKKCVYIGHMMKVKVCESPLTWKY